MSLFESLIECFVEWARHNHYDILVELAAQHVLVPSTLLQFLEEVPTYDQLVQLLPMFEPMCAHFDGGIDALVDHGLDPPAIAVRTGIQLAYLLRPNTFADLISERCATRTGFINALMTVQSIQGKLDHKTRFADLLGRLTDDRPGPAVGAGKLVMHVLCDPNDLGAASWAAALALSPAQRLRCYGALAVELYNLKYSAYNGEVEPFVPHGAAVPLGWLPFQVVLDGILPLALDTPADLRDNRR